MKPLLIEDSGDVITIKINKTEVNGAFLDSMVKRIEFERLVSKAEVDPAIIWLFQKRAYHTF